VPAGGGSGLRMAAICMVPDPCGRIEIRHEGGKMKQYDEIVRRHISSMVTYGL